jgi:uncharacterized ferredoxin-like protein
VAGSARSTPPASGEDDDVMHVVLAEVDRVAPAVERMLVSSGSVRSSTLTADLAATMRSATSFEVIGAGRATRWVWRA